MVVNPPKIFSNEEKPPPPPPYLHGANVIVDIITYRVICIGAYLHDVNFIAVSSEVLGGPVVIVVFFKQIAAAKHLLRHSGTVSGHHVRRFLTLRVAVES